MVFVRYSLDKVDCFGTDRTGDQRSDIVFSGLMHSLLIFDRIRL